VFHWPSENRYRTRVLTRLDSRRNSAVPQEKQQQISNSKFSTVCVTFPARSLDRPAHPRRALLQFWVLGTICSSDWLTVFVTMRWPPSPATIFTGGGTTPPAAGPYRAAYEVGGVQMTWRCRASTRFTPWTPAPWPPAAALWPCPAAAAATISPDATAVGWVGATGPALPPTAAATAAAYWLTSTYCSVRPDDEPQLRELELPPSSSWSPPPPPHWHRTRATSYSHGCTKKGFF